MYTVFHPDQDTFVREALARHSSFEKGKWSARGIRMHQREQLRETLRHVRAGSPFYAKRLKHLTDDQIESFELEDLPSLPFTTKVDLRANALAMLSKPISDGWVFYETTGTTGRPTPCPRDNIDSAVNNIALTVNYASVLRKHPGPHFIGVMGPSELHSTGDTFGEVFRNLGHAVAKMWAHSPVVGYRRALEVMREYRITALVCTPGMAMSLAREARLIGISPQRDFGLSFIMVIGELVTPALLDNISSIWSAQAYNCMYASQESSILAAVRDDGNLRTVPLNNYYEIIDSDTGVHVDPDDYGVLQGELVISHLYQGCKPLVRYRTGDLVRLVPPKNGDAYPSRIMQPLGRALDIVTINGVDSYAYDIEQTVLAHVTTCCGYQIVIDNEDGRDRLAVTFECLDPRRVDVVDEESVRRVVYEKYGVVPQIRIGEIGTIATTGAMVSWKASRIHDRRQPDDAERLAALAIARQRDTV
jgi:phenylacetate-CoA ligase